MVNKVVIIDALTYCVCISFDAWSNESTWTCGTLEIIAPKLTFMYTVYTCQPCFFLDFSIVLSFTCFIACHCRASVLTNQLIIMIFCSCNILDPFIRDRKQTMTRTATRTAQNNDCACATFFFLSCLLWSNNWKWPSCAYFREDRQ